MTQATVVPCTPYEKSVYDVSEGKGVMRTGVGFSVRVHESPDMLAKYGVPFLTVDGKFIAVMPKYV